MLKIKQVENASLGEEMGFEQGDAILSFQGFKTVDLLDYMYYDAQTNFEMGVLTKAGEEITVEVDKEEGESLGFIFEDDGLEIRTCRNDCLFCFVRQMPSGMRESLYVKDDDYRQSFFCGNFVTLTNVSDEEIERIIRLNLSPLYVSVHTLNGELRKKMLNNRFADKINAQLSRLCEGGIDIHAQIVLVKGVNDGKHLDYTIDRLYSLNNVKTVAVVPCGITKYRQGLYPIEDIDGDYALSIINQVKSANERHGGHLVDLADEFYFKANQPLPSANEYGDFWQVENGVGMSAKLMQDVEEIIKFSQKPLLKKGRYLTFTGTSAHQFMCSIVKKVESACKDVTIDVVAIENDFFGHTVNCTGLLTGGDVIKNLLPYKGKYDCLLVPNPCLMQFEDRFLDDVTLQDIATALDMKAVRAVIND